MSEGNYRSREHKRAATVAFAALALVGLSTFLASAAGFQFLPGWAQFALAGLAAVTTVFAALASEGRLRGGTVWWLLVSSVAVLVVITTIGAAMHPGLPSPPSIQQSPQARSASCTHPVGYGNPVGYRPEFLIAYDENGGARRLGCPTESVMAHQGGYFQSLTGPLGNGVILGTGLGAYVFVGDMHTAWVQEIGGAYGGSMSISIAGYPDGWTRLRHGEKVTLASGGKNPSALIRRDGGEWHYVPDNFLKRYEEEGGPEGWLGYPTGRFQDNGQDFENGSFIFKDGRVLTRPRTAR
jgi:hypothetical protein